MQIYKRIIEAKPSKLARILTIAVVLLAAIIIGYNVFAADVYPMSVKHITEQEPIIIGDEIAVELTIENTSDEAVNQTYIQATIAKSTFKLKEDSVYVQVNNGDKQQAIEGRNANDVKTSDTYKYKSVNGSGTYIYISTGIINSKDIITVYFTIIAQTEGAEVINYLAYKDGTAMTLMNSIPTEYFYPNAPVVYAAAEKTSQNMNSDAVDEDGNYIANVGDIIEYTITATNELPRTESLWRNVLVSDTLPDGVSLVDGSVTINDRQATSEEYEYNESTRTLTVNVGDLAGGEPPDVAVVKFYAKVNDDAYGKNIKNKTTVSGVDNYDSSSISTEAEDDKNYRVDSTVKITFDKNNEEATGTMDVQVAQYLVETKISKNEYALEGYTFLGWSKDPNASYPDYLDEVYITPSGNITLYAVWSANQYTITFNKNADDAVGEMSPQTVNAFETVILNENKFTRPGYAFMGWSETASGSVKYYDKQSIEVGSSNINLYAAWSANQYTITFYKNADDAVGEMSPQTVNAFETVNLSENTFTRPGYAFVGWSETETGTVKYDDKQSIEVGNSNINLYAVWSINQYTITFYKNADDVVGDMSPQTVNAFETVTLSENRFTRPGYAFIGWSESASGTVKYYDKQSIEVGSTNINLYAVWSINQYTITFNANAEGVEGAMPNQLVSADETTVTLNENKFTRYGYNFMGWSVDPSATTATYKDKQVITVAGDMTLYAVWSKTECIITFVKNNDEGAEGTMADQTVYVGERIQLNPNEFVGLHVGSVQYVFAGWSYSPDTNYGDVEFKDEDYITVSANTTLYAIWNRVAIREDHIAYINGYEDGAVRIEQNISRAEAAVIFYRLLDESVHTDKNDSVKNYFNDVAIDDWFYQAVNYMAKNNVLDGYEDGTFKPKQYITRAEFAKIASIFDNLELTEENYFPDVESNHWAVKYINSAYIKGWVDGYENGTFQANQQILRAEVVTVVNRMANRSVDPDVVDIILNPYSDISVRHWAYEDVLEASIEHEYVRDDDGNEIWTSWIINGVTYEK